MDKICPKFRIKSSKHTEQGFLKMMKIKFYTTPSEINNAFCELVEKSEKIYISSAWATENHEAYKLLLQNKIKIERFFCGIHNNWTTPKVMKDFLGNDSFRVVDDCELFHIKTYLFKYIDKKNVTTWETLVGSANFTNSGFNKNFELVQHTIFDILIDLHEELEKKFLSRSLIPDEAFINEYTLDFMESQKVTSQEEKQRKHQKNSFYRLTWEDYFDRIQNDTSSSLNGRIMLLKRYSKLLSENTFENLDVEDRKKIAGTYIGKDNDITIFDSRWFGGMSGAGTFSGKVISEAKAISEAMLNIPKLGEVTEDHYKAFMEKMIPASGYWKDPLAVSTRILAMLRPDYFFCVTSANKENLADDLRFPKTSLKVDNYWEKVIEPLKNSMWWQKKDFNSDLEKDVWNSRVALLDILYYKLKD